MVTADIYSPVPPPQVDRDQTMERVLLTECLYDVLGGTRKMEKRSSPDDPGPAIWAVDPWIPTAGRTNQLLTAEERSRLAAIASIVQFKKREVIYREGDHVDAIFNIISGVVTTYRKAPNGSEHIAAFLLVDDLFGLSEEGRYTNSAKAITPVAVYRLPLIALRSYLYKSAELEFHVICKLCQEIRQAQRHAFLLSQREAVSRLAMFLRLIEQLQISRGEQTAEIYLPMDRSDIGEYIGMTLPAVSRTFRRLTAQGIVKIRAGRHVRITDRNSFRKMAGDQLGPSDIE
jgi:CRP-like cAMP-binding protein